MFVYKRTEKNLWTVGHYDGNKWVPESDHGTAKEAGIKAACLNGSGGYQLPNLNFYMLREHKELLLEAINKYPELEELDGIVHLIDAIQDQAVDLFKYPEEEVFGHKD